LGAHLFCASLPLEHPPKGFSETFDLYYSTQATKIPLFIDILAVITAKIRQIAEIALTNLHKISIFILMELITIS
jgi:hypothetical protein